MKANLKALSLAVATLLLAGCKPGGAQEAQSASDPATTPAPQGQADDGALTPERALTVLRSYFTDHSVMCAYGTTFPLQADKRDLKYRPGLQHLIDAGVVDVTEENGGITLTPQAPYLDNARGLMCAGKTEPLAVTLKPVSDNLVGVEFTLNIKGVQPWAASPLTTAKANPGFMAPAEYAGETLRDDAQLERTSDGWRVVGTSVGKPKAQ